MRPTLIVGRHGQCEDNAAGRLNGLRDSRLTELGRRQAEATARRLEESGVTINASYSSDLARAAETADIITGRLGLATAQRLPILRERDLGIVTGKLISEALMMIQHEHIIRTPYVAYAEHPHYGFESFAKTQERMREFLSLITRSHRPQETVLVIAHGDSGLALVAEATGQKMKDLIYTFYFGNADIVRIAASGMVSIELLG